MQEAEELQDHIRSPYHHGELKDATHKFSVRNPACGDEVTLQLRIRDQRIEEAWHIVRGCSLCLGTTSILCSRIEGLRVQELQEFPADWTLSFFDFPVTKGRIGCCVLPMTALQAILKAP